MLWAWGGAENRAEQPEVSGGPGWEGRDAGESQFVKSVQNLSCVLFVCLTVSILCDHSIHRRKTSTRRRSRFSQTSWRRWVRWLISSSGPSCWIYPPCFSYKVLPAVCNVDLSVWITNERLSPTQAETRAEFAERSVAKLEKTIDDLEGTSLFHLVFSLSCKVCRRFNFFFHSASTSCLNAPPLECFSSWYSWPLVGSLSNRNPF